MNKNSAYIFCIGRELLDGVVLDRNANFMAHKLSEAGARVLGIQVVDPAEETMIEAFQTVLKRSPRYVFTTGGMGPGHDDTTRACVAKAAGSPLQADQQAADMVAKSYRRLYAKGIVDCPDLNEDRLRMAQVPSGATCYENPIGTAPAVRVRVRDSVFFLLPGVPEELQRMFNLYVLPALSSEGSTSHKRSRHIEFPGRDESALSRVLADLSRRYPELHSKARVQTAGEGAGIRITISGDDADEQALEKMLDRAEADARSRLGLEIGSGSRPSTNAVD